MSRRGFRKTDRKVIAIPTEDRDHIILSFTLPPALSFALSPGTYGCASVESNGDVEIRSRRTTHHALTLALDLINALAGGSDLVPFSLRAHVAIEKDGEEPAPPQQWVLTWLQGSLVASRAFELPTIIHGELRARRPARPAKPRGHPQPRSHLPELGSGG